MFNTYPYSPPPVFVLEWAVRDLWHRAIGDVTSWQAALPWTPAWKLWVSCGQASLTMWIRLKTFVESACTPTCTCHQILFPFTSIGSGNSGQPTVQPVNGNFLIALLEKYTENIAVPIVVTMPAHQMIGPNHFRFWNRLPFSHTHIKWSTCLSLLK